MSLLNYLRRKTAGTSVASVAKERLQIIISHERSQRNASDSLSKLQLPKLQEELMAVITKYIHNINRDQVSVHIEQMGNNAVLELNVTVPDALEEV